MLRRGINLARRVIHCCLFYCMQSELWQRKETTATMMIRTIAVGGGRIKRSVTEGLNEYTSYRIVYGENVITQE